MYQPRRIRQRRTEAKKKRGRQKKTDFNDVVNYAIGELGIKPHDFWFHYTFADYQRVAYYHIKSREQDYKNEWEAARYMAVANNLVKNNTNGRFNKDLTFSWEVESKKKKINTKETSQEEMSRVSAYWNELFKQQINANSRN